jgi:RNA polymerase sigma-70 factor, ECF subfamily
MSGAMSLENIPAEQPALALPSQQTGALLDQSRSAADAQRVARQLDDNALVARAQQGDRAAFEELVQRYDRDVLRLALNLLHNSEEARDVYQEAFLKVYRNLHRFRLDSSFYTWLYRIVTNVCLDHMRRRRVRPEDQAPVSASALHEDLPERDFFDQQSDASPDPEQSLLGQEIGERISRAMASLSPRERMIFELKHKQGLRLRAIGEALGTTEETVKNSLFRATRKLRAQLGELL